jgi:hypothetical protein
MISLNLSIDQLITVIHNLDEAEKLQVRKALDGDDIMLTEEQKLEILTREKDYKNGRMKVYSLDEVKTSLNFHD